MGSSTWNRNMILLLPPELKKKYIRRTHLEIPPLYLPQDEPVKEVMEKGEMMFLSRHPMTRFTHRRHNLQRCNSNVRLTSAYYDKIVKKQWYRGVVKFNWRRHYSKKKYYKEEAGNGPPR